MSWSRASSRLGPGSVWSRPWRPFRPPPGADRRVRQLLHRPPDLRLRAGHRHRGGRRGGDPVPADRDVSRDHAAAGGGDRHLSGGQRRGRGADGGHAHRAAGQRRRGHDLHVLPQRQRRDHDAHGDVQGRRRPRHRRRERAEPGVHRPGQAPRGRHPPGAHHRQAESRSGRDRRLDLARREPGRALPGELRHAAARGRAGAGARRRSGDRVQRAGLWHASLAEPRPARQSRAHRRRCGRRGSGAEPPGRGRADRPASVTPRAAVPVHRHHARTPLDPGRVRGHHPPHPLRRLAAPRPRCGARGAGRPELRVVRPSRRQAGGAVSVALSALNALTLTPALCALLLRPGGATRKRWLARTWNAAFLRLTNGYDRSVRRIVQRSALAVVLLLLLSGAGYALLRAVPTGFAPTEDQGYLLVNVQLPDAASVERTDAVVRQIEQILLETPGVETVVAIGGRSFITGVNGPNVASLFPRLTPWSKRKAPELQAGAILARLRARLSSLQEASIVVFPPPPIRGISSGGGFQFELQSVAGGSLQELDVTARKIMDAARQRPELAATFTGFRAGVPQLDAQVDRAKAKALGVPLSDVFSSLQIFLGSLYVNDFNAFGRVYRVQLQAEPSFRASPNDVARLYVRSQPGANGQAAQMVPLSTLVSVKPITGPDTISHYNLYRTAEIAGDTAPGASSGQAIAAMQDVARTVMPPGMAYEWTGLAYQEIEAGSRAGFVFALSALFVFLVLAAQYESWLVPLAVLLAVPLGVLGALGALWLGGLANDVYAQIGLALLMGLASKNAILIVEFAKERREHGAEIQDAAREAARLRFRPILMTSFAFILGSLPLVFATGAGAASRNSMGTTVVGGMLAVTVIGVLLVPAFYVAVERLAEWRRRPVTTSAAPRGDAREVPGR